MNRLVRLFLVIVMLALCATRFGSTAVSAQSTPAVVGLVVNEDADSIAVIDPASDRVIGLLNAASGATNLDKPHLAPSMGRATGCISAIRAATWSSMTCRMLWPPGWWQT